MTIAGTLSLGPGWLGSTRRRVASASTLPAAHRTDHHFRRRAAKPECGYNQAKRSRYGELPQRWR